VLYGCWVFELDDFDDFYEFVELFGDLFEWEVFDVDDYGYL